MNKTILNDGLYEVTRNGNIVLASGSYIDAALAMLTYAGCEYEIRPSWCDGIELEWYLFIKTCKSEWTQVRLINSVYANSYDEALFLICNQITYWKATDWGFEIGCLN